MFILLNTVFTMKTKIEHGTFQKVLPALAGERIFDVWQF